MNSVGKNGKQNRNAGNHPSYEKRGMSESSIEKKKEYDSKFQKNRNKYRALLNKKNKEMGSKVGDGKDVSHTKEGFKLESQSKNRGSKTNSAGDKRARG